MPRAPLVCRVTRVERRQRTPVVDVPLSRTKTPNREGATQTSSATTATTARTDFWTTDEFHELIIQLTLVVNRPLWS